jgi:hypothetical protein
MLLNLHWPFEIETNASDYAMCIVITQVGHLIAFYSKKSSDIVCKYLTYERELYDIIQAIKQLRHYFKGKK